jgi:hypothetical protein
MAAGSRYLNAPVVSRINPRESNSCTYVKENRVTPWLNWNNSRITPGLLFLEMSSDYQEMISQNKTGC